MSGEGGSPLASAGAFEEANDDPIMGLDDALALPVLNDGGGTIGVAGCSAFIQSTR